MTATRAARRRTILRTPANHPGEYPAAAVWAIRVDPGSHRFEEASARPLTMTEPMDDALFPELDQTLASAGPDAAVERLCERLRTAGDPTALFYALLMQSRHGLGVPPTPTRPSSELPESVHEAYETAIRSAGRAAGQVCLAAGDLPRAWGFFRMLG